MTDDTRPLAERSAALRAEEAEHDAAHLAVVTEAANGLLAVLRGPAAAALKAEVDALITTATPAAEAVLGETAKARARVTLMALTRVSQALRPPAERRPAGGA